MIGDRSDRGPCDQMGEAGFADTAAFHVAIDDPTVRFEHFRRNVSKAGRRWNTEACFHVLDDAGCGAA